MFYVWTQLKELLNNKRIDSLAEEKGLAELDKRNLLPILLSQPPCLIYFAVFCNLHLWRPPVYSGPKCSCFTDIIGFIFNNYSSFVNQTLHLNLCGDEVYICKIKKNMVSCYAVADKLLVQWLPRELWQL